MLDYIKFRIAIERLRNVIFFPIEKAINIQPKQDIDNKQKYAKILKWKQYTTSRE
jgi:hypothetical protein